MAELDIEAGKKVVIKGLILLGVVTLVEVFIALFGNGHVIDGFHLPKWLMYPMMIGLSLYKAYFIIFEFMHMKYEVKGLRSQCAFTTVLLIWAMLALLNEGSAWGNSNAKINKWNTAEPGKKATAPPTKEMK